MALVPSMTHLCWLWGGKSTPDMDPAPDQYLDCNFGLHFHCIDILLIHAIFKIQHFVPSLHSWWLDLKYSFTNRGCFFQMIILSTTSLCYVENWTFCPIFPFISILIALCLHKPYISLFMGNFGSLEWQFGMYCFYVDLETFSKIKLICVPIQYYWSIPFPAVNSVFFYLFMCMPNICIRGTNYTFL